MPKLYLPVLLSSFILTTYPADRYDLFVSTNVAAKSFRNKFSEEKVERRGKAGEKGGAAANWKAAISTVPWGAEQVLRHNCQRTGTILFLSSMRAYTLKYKSLAGYFRTKKYERAVKQKRCVTAAAHLFLYFQQKRKSSSNLHIPKFSNHY
ncbi:hypothetical protein I2I11_08965 [Pontibacter sp. 172403-2]|uniref:hypothetical protein n=1 Tax=Pontibacter rufus TaxID=2791028 RepID=UPI0018AFB63F|nr:hypothetical protein [Pontibacter sp. 172403-2]MBF9253421.1 hypothetical protein [Pontibacter sp. 172403-2]